MLALAYRLIVGAALLTLAAPQASANVEGPSKFNSEAVAVIIGNSNYTHGDIPPVKYAHRDADAMAAFARNVLGLRKENIIILKDASQAQMESAFGRPGNPRGKAFQYVRPGESDLLVFYSGHGVPGPNDGKRYLLPSDADLATVDINGYPLSELYKNLTQTQARSVTVFLDACFSGTSPGGTLLPNASGITIVPENTAEPKSSPVPLTVITAASADQLASWDKDTQHGLFTEYLLQGLYGQADKAPYGVKDGKVTLKEVSAYLNREMRYRARRDYNREQVPYISGNPDTILAVAKGGAFPERATLPEPEVISPKDTPTPETVKVSLSPMDELMIATTNANVRNGPGTEFAKVALLSEGVEVTVIGRVTNKPWLLVEHDGKRLGYVYEDLLAAYDVETITTEEIFEEPKEVITPPRFPPEPRNMRQPPRDVRPGQFPPRQRVPRDLHRQPRRTELPPPELELLKNMRMMGQILQDQRHVISVPVHIVCANKGSQIQCRKKAVSSLSYTRITPRPAQCALEAHMNFHHDKLTLANGHQKRIDIRNQPILQPLRNNSANKVKTLTIKSRIDGLVKTVRYYQYGELIFSNKKDRNAFAKLARKTANICRDRRPPLARR